jgi:hypothetical protein
VDQALSGKDVVTDRTPTVRRSTIWDLPDFDAKAFQSKYLLRSAARI